MLNRGLFSEVTLLLSVVKLCQLHPADHPQHRTVSVIRSVTVRKLLATCPLNQADIREAIACIATFLSRHCDAQISGLRSNPPLYSGHK